MADLPIYFTREGRQVAYEKIRFHGAETFTMEPRPCSRCGGEGRSERWARTGRTCFDCGGSGQHKNGPAKVKLYTAEKVAKLNAAGEKRLAKRNAARDAKEAQFKAAADARQAGFLAVHRALIARAQGFAGRSEFVADVLAKGLARNELSEKQAAALGSVIDKIEAEDKRRASAGWVGKVGERLKGLKVKVARSMVINPGSYYEPRFVVVIMHDEAGNTLVYKGASFCPEKDYETVIAATVKAHEDYNGEKQTIIQRLKEAD